MSEHVRGAECATVSQPLKRPRPVDLLRLPITATLERFGGRAELRRGALEAGALVG